LESVVELLKQKHFCDKASVEQKSSECTLIVCVKRGNLYLISLSSYRDWLYARIVPEYGMPVGGWTCSQTYYTPYGLYVFSKSIDELVEKMKKKEKMLEAIARLAFEKTTLVEE